MESIGGKTEAFIKGSLSKGLKMGKASGKRMHKILIAISMKGNMKMIRRMVKEFLLGRVETFTKVLTGMMREMAMVKCFGLMGRFIKENGAKVYSMDWVK